MNPTTINPSPIASFLDSVHLGPHRACDRLALWPLVLDEPRTGPPPLEYVPLADALGKGDAEIDEVSAGGSVPNVRVRNRGEPALLVLFGEQLEGAKQNRIANATFLVPGRSELVIDVSCVEAGRWSHTRGHAARFGRSGPLVSASLRHRMSRQVHRSREETGRYFADQADVWSEVDSRLSRSRTVSPTRAYADYTSTYAEDLGRLRKAFGLVDDQVGFVAAIDERVAGVEAIGSPGVFAACFQRLLDAYAIDAVGPARAASPKVAPGVERSPDRGVGADAFLDALRSVPADPAPSLGLGEDLRLRTREVEGCALAAGDLIHLTAAPRPQEEDRRPKRPADLFSA